MFIVLDVPEEVAKRGICHTRSNGEIIKEFFLEDAVLNYKITTTNALFIIDVKPTDSLISNEVVYSVEGYFTTTSIFTYGNSFEILKLYDYILSQNKELPAKFNNLLSDNLNFLFENSAKRQFSSYDSKTIYLNYQPILRHLNKSLTDFVEQDKIDSFMKNAISLYTLEDVNDLISNSDIVLNEENIKLLEVAKNRFNQIIAITKNTLAEKNLDNLKANCTAYNIFNIDLSSLNIKGDSKVTVFFNSDGLSAFIDIPNNYNGNTKINVTEFLKESF